LRNKLSLSYILDCIYVVATFLSHSQPFKCYAYSLDQTWSNTKRHWRLFTVLIYFLNNIEQQIWEFNAFGRFLFFPPLPPALHLVDQDADHILETFRVLARSVNLPSIVCKVASHPGITARSRASCQPFSWLPSSCAGLLPPKSVWAILQVWGEQQRHPKQKSRQSGKDAIKLSEITALISLKSK
jgi:hypothetical protein